MKSVVKYPKPTDPLRICANGIIGNMKRPEKFHQFLLDAAGWVYNCQVASRGSLDKHTHWYVTMLLEFVSLPWLLSKSKEEAEKKVAAGLSAIADYFNQESASNVTASITMAFAFDMKESNVTAEYGNDCFNALKLMNTLPEALGRHLREYYENKKATVETAAA